MPRPKPPVALFGQVDFDKMQAVETPQESDIFVCRQGADGGNVFQTRAQIRAGARDDLIEKVFIDTTVVGNVGAGEDDLMTFNLPADSLNANGRGVRISTWGTTAGNVNAKTIRLFFGATNIRQLGPSAINDLDWRIDGLVFRSGVGSQVAVATEFLDQSFSDSTNSTPAEDETGVIVIRVTGEGVANDDITQLGMLIELL